MTDDGRRRQAAGNVQICRQATACRPALTLFEVLLVLVLMVVVGSLAAPLLEGSFASIRLRRGTDQVLAAWSDARTHAIEAGQIYQFRFRPAGSDYRVDLWSGGLERDPFEPSPLDNAESPAASASTAAELELASFQVAARLPATIVFSSAESVSADERGQRTVARLDQDSTTEWSAPILFYPDGTTSAASVLLKNEKAVYRRATLRAWTGVARASDLLTREEVERWRSQ